MSKKPSMEWDEILSALRAALNLAEVPCGSYPTPEGWERERLANTRVVQKAYRALDLLAAAPSPSEKEPAR